MSIVSGLTSQVKPLTQAHYSLSIYFDSFANRDIDCFVAGYLSDIGSAALIIPNDMFRIGHSAWFVYGYPLVLVAIIMTLRTGYVVSTGVGFRDACRQHTSTNYDCHYEC
jgi:hypothetical protein